LQAPATQTAPPVHAASEVQGLPSLVHVPPAQTPLQQSPSVWQQASVPPQHISYPALH
jgi:hypothetical protein